MQYSRIFTVLEAPTNISPQPGVNAIVLHWNSPAVGGGAATVRQYNVKWEPGDMVLALSFQNTITVPATRTSTRISNLTSNTRYNIFVSATSSRNEEGARAEISATTCEFCY